MERICRRGDGLFPSPKEIQLSCSCPDWADMCKHVAAVLYGVGARLDQQPELLFVLRGVDERELIAGAGGDLRLGHAAPDAGKVLEGGDLAALFGLDMAAPLAETAADGAPAEAVPAPAARSRPRREARSEPTGRAGKAPVAGNKAAAPAAEAPAPAAPARIRRSVRSDRPGPAKAGAAVGARPATPTGTTPAPATPAQPERSQRSDRKVLVGKRWVKQGWRPTRRAGRGRPG